MITLTWNGSNELGDGAGVENSKGLSDFGKKLVKELCIQYNININLGSLSNSVGEQ